MYTVTFYSFKGGVGRTLALVNVAVELAKMGRRVLLVDFDLEAPGLDSFNLPKPKVPTDGIVEYVSHYLRSGTPAHVDEYIYECPGVGSRDGGIWIMPSGNPEKQYAWNLSQINWQMLYEERDGFFLFEDLKNQWKELVAADYVLIDSRTGHTDIEGTCTRQLPDAVVAMFFPNSQNLRGLRRVVSDIRSEDQRIQLHFVMSNVPDIDDEGGILAAQMREFKDALGYETLTATIHRYDNLALLRQAIFAIEFPNSRLTAEYRRLAKRIIEENGADRDGALRFLDSLQQPIGARTRFRGSTADLAEKLKGIRDAHSGDGEVLFRLAGVQKGIGQWENALQLLDDAVDAKYETPEVLLERAECREACADTEGAVSDLGSVLKSTSVPAVRLSYAIHLLRRVDPKALKMVGRSAAIGNLEASARIGLARDLAWAKEGLSSAREILSQIMTTDNKGSGGEQLEQARGDLILYLIGEGDFERAIETIGPVRPASGQERAVADYFNYAMAEWGETGIPPKDLLRRVVELESGSTDNQNSANRLQCFALAYWGLAMDEEAEGRVQLAKQRAMARPTAEFSCWRYLMTPRREFLRDLAALSRMIRGEKLLPDFLMRAREARSVDAGSAVRAQPRTGND